MTNMSKMTRKLVKNGPGGPGIWWLVCRFVACALFWGWVSSAQADTDSQGLVAKVLSKADAAMAAKRFILPEHNNAYDRYKAVLSVVPNHPQAMAGLAAIETHYANLAEAELLQGSFQHAQFFVNVLSTRFPSAQALPGLKSRLDKALGQQAIPVVKDYGIKTIALNAGDLTAKNAAIKSTLIEVANRIAKTKEAVLIRARSDAEGRWIYQTLNEAATHRVRGDIRLSRSPALELQEPL
jgi:hypothetical protein